MSEAASHAASSEGRVYTLEHEARSLFGKQPDAIQAHLVIDAGEHITPKDDGGLTHNTWIAAYALARATQIIAWQGQQIERLELEASGQSSLFDAEEDV